MRKSILIALFGLSLANLNPYSVTSRKQVDINIERQAKEVARVNNASSSTTTPTLNTHATYYFYNLTEHFPKNYKGTCTFVAMAMLLQYYDTFWDDNIIPYQYDVSPVTTQPINQRTSSPGIKTDKIPRVSHDEAMELTNEEYLEYMLSMSDTYFQPFLFEIAYELDMLSMYTEDCFASLNQTGRRLFLNHYLQTVSGFSTSDYTLTTYNNDYDPTKSTQVRSYIINKVKLGIPVLVVMEWSGYSHACIAYDYDESLNQIYIHYGDYQAHTHDETDVSIRTYYMSATTLEFHTPHRHSNNYGLVTYGNVTYHCGCEIVL